jgi:NAD(P)-dependent dehydrogenase (short-subunit alcohol dehydrogenase family)
MSDVTRSVAVVTGAASGIGRATALALSREGHRSRSAIATGPDWPTWPRPSNGPTATLA